MIDPDKLTVGTVVHCHYSDEWDAVMQAIHDDNPKSNIYRFDVYNDCIRIVHRANGLDWLRGPYSYYYNAGRTITEFSDLCTDYNDIQEFDFDNLWNQ